MLKIAAVAALFALSSCAGAPVMADDVPAPLGGVEDGFAVFCDTAEQAAFLVRALHDKDDDVIAAVSATDKHFGPGPYGAPCAAGPATLVRAALIDVITDIFGARFELWNVVVLPQPGHDEMAPVEQVGIFPVAGRGV